MLIRFWGTRGSLAKPGPGTLRYGGNISCVEVRTASGTLIVLDCGTGANGLGHALVAGRSPVRGHLMITHTHWDHIQGFPFFAPLFARGNEWDIYAPGGLGQQLEQTLAGQMEYTYFPVTLKQLGATIRYHDLVEGSFMLDEVRVVTKYLNHPALGFLLAAASLWLLGEDFPSARQAGRRRTAARLGATAVVAIGAVTAVGYLLGDNLGLDQVMFRSRLGANRVAPNTALNFTLVGAALLLLDREPGGSSGSASSWPS